MTHPAFTALSVSPGPAGVADVARALSALMAGTGGGFEIVPPGHGPGGEAPHDPTAIVVHTSGSTGVPRRVEIALSALIASADLGATALGEPGAWLTAVPVGGMGGLLTVLRSLRAGMDPEGWPGLDGAAAFPSGFAEAARAVTAAAERAGSPSYTSLVPTQVHRLLGDKEATEAAARFGAVLVGGAPLSPGLRARAQGAGIRVVATYGATETGGGVVYDGVPLPGVAVSMNGDRIRLGGPTIASRYLDEPDPRLTGGWFDTGDLGVWDDGRLTVLGRDDDVIKSGGQKVSLGAITAVLVTDERVLDAVTVARDDAEWGQVPHAYVVPSSAAPEDDLLDDLADRITAALGRRHRPPTMSVVSTIPVSAGGKPVRSPES